MNLSDLIRGKPIRDYGMSATLTLATDATVDRSNLPRVATVTPVSVAIPQESESTPTATIFPIDRIEMANRALEAFACQHSIPWPTIRPHLTDADLLGGLEALEHYGGPVDEKNLALVRWWLEQVANRGRHPQD